ncbi:MAG TPA: RNA polymerase sigma factor [Steroidobacteraceae bacterium]|nr:RNA polymerase sigma factor [Steroidobacteraceae bacterium]
MDGGVSLDWLTDGELVTLSLRGVPSAFSQLLGRHGAHLRRILTKRTRNPEDVLDLLQETYLAAWRALRSYDLGRPFEAWLTAIALNKCRDWARHRTRQTGLLSRIHAHATATGGGVHERSAERRAIEEEAVRDLGRALHRLPRSLREPLVLTTLAEFSQASVARELRVTRKAVEMRVRRARRRLARALEGAAPRSGHWHAAANGCVS